MIFHHNEQRQHSFNNTPLLPARNEWNKTIALQATS